MNRKLISAIMVLGLLPLASYAAEKNKQLEEALKIKYQLAQVGLDRFRITKAGMVLVIEKDGIYANPSDQLMGMTTKIKDGAIVTQGKFLTGLSTSEEDRTLKVGTAVQVTRISLTDKDVRMEIITSDPEEMSVRGNSKQVRYIATLIYEFPEGFLASADADGVKKAIDAVLLPQTEVGAANTKTVELGQTEDQVKAALGAPDKIIKLGAKEEFVYKDIKVIFIDGKVSDVQ